MFSFLSTKKINLNYCYILVFKNFDGDAVGNFCKVPEMSKRNWYISESNIKALDFYKVHDLPHSLSKAEEGR